MKFVSLDASWWTALIQLSQQIIIKHTRTFPFELTTNRLKQSLAGAGHRPALKPWLVPFVRRLCGWTENGCERTSPSAEPPLRRRQPPADGTPRPGTLAEAVLKTPGAGQEGLKYQNWEGKKLYNFIFSYIKCVRLGVKKKYCKEEKKNTTF